VGAAEDINRIKRINRISGGLKIPYPLNKRSNSIREKLPFGTFMPIEHKE
jgi:hypothetical protein